MRKSRELLKRKHIFLLIILIFLINGFIRKVPNGTSVKGLERLDANAEFLYDLTYEKDGDIVKEQNIFNEQLVLIDEAKEFIIVDMFLFNDDYNRSTDVIYPNLSEQLTSKLIDKKSEIPDIKILFITDEINNFYGAYESPYIKRLKENDIDVVITDLEKIRDSNPLYAGIWRSAIKWFGTSGRGWLPNPFSPDSPKVTARGYLKLLNFKANHRKVIATENNAIIASMNPHDASGNHSNIALKVGGSIIEDIVVSEINTAEFSGYKDGKDFNISDIRKTGSKGLDKASLITEGKIRNSLIEEISKTSGDSEINIAMFYLSHRGIVNELIKAANRGVELKLILDPNKDAFGIKKNGLPNRQVAHEIHRKTNKSNIVRWYDTQGEQFHTKMAIIRDDNKSVIIGGSANFTRRNLDDYNLETNLMVETPRGSNLDREVDSYFSRIWNNEGSNYTLDYSSYENRSKFKTAIYRLQEWSGLSSF